MIPVGHVSLERPLLTAKVSRKTKAPIKRISLNGTEDYSLETGPKHSITHVHYINIFNILKSEVNVYNSRTGIRRYVIGSPVLEINGPF